MVLDAIRTPEPRRSPGAHVEPEGRYAQGSMPARLFATDLHVVVESADPEASLIPGHEIVGTVDRAGSAVDRFKHSDRGRHSMVGWTWVSEIVSERPEISARARSHRLSARRRLASAALRRPALRIRNPTRPYRDGGDADAMRRLSDRLSAPMGNAGEGASRFLRLRARRRHSVGAVVASRARDLRLAGHGDDAAASVSPASSATVWGPAVRPR